LVLFNFLIFLEPDCKCKCGGECKRRQLLIDVLVKYFYRDEYDEKCCREGCNCPKGAKCDKPKTQDSKTYNLLLKLFKPQNGDAQVTEVKSDDKNMSVDEKREFSRVAREMIARLNNFIAKNDPKK
jgi:hypothetical protein